MGGIQTENPVSKSIRPEPGTLTTSTMQPIQMIKVDGSPVNFALLYHLPGLCIKTVSEPSKEKVFVNICQSNSVPPPPEISREELVELLQSEDPSEFRVPMSLGMPHTEMDNSKQSKYHNFSSEGFSYACRISNVQVWTVRLKKVNLSQQNTMKQLWQVPHPSSYSDARSSLG